jgi:vacuolar protein sorting-associated protein 13A/C
MREVSLYIPPRTIIDVTFKHAPSGDSSITVQFADQVWEKLSGIPVDMEGEYTFALRPRAEKYYNRLLCEVKVEASTKIVTLRSTYRVHNRTLYPLEIAVGEGGESSNGGVVVVKLGMTCHGSCGAVIS